MGRRNWATLSEEQIAQLRAQDAERKRLRRQQESAEERARRRARNAEKAREYRATLRATNPVLAAKKRAEAALRMRLKRALEYSSSKDGRNKRDGTSFVPRTSIDLSHVFLQVSQWQEEIRQLSMCRENQWDKKDQSNCPLGMGVQNLALPFQILTQNAQQLQTPLASDISAMLSGLLGRTPTISTIGAAPFYTGTTLSTALLTTSMLASAQPIADSLNPLLSNQPEVNDNPNEAGQVVGIPTSIPIPAHDSLPTGLCPLQAQPSPVSVGTASPSTPLDIQNMSLSPSQSNLLSEPGPSDFFLPPALQSSGLSTTVKDKEQLHLVQGRPLLPPEGSEPALSSSTFPLADMMLTSQGNQPANLQDPAQTTATSISSVFSNLSAIPPTLMPHLAPLQNSLLSAVNPTLPNATDLLSQQLQPILSIVSNPVAMFEIVRLFQMGMQSNGSLPDTAAALSPHQQLSLTNLIASSVPQNIMASPLPSTQQGTMETHSNPIVQLSPQEDNLMPVEISNGSASTAESSVTPLTGLTTPAMTGLSFVTQDSVSTSDNTRLGAPANSFPTTASVDKTNRTLGSGLFDSLEPAHGSSTGKSFEEDSERLHSNEDTDSSSQSTAYPHDPMHIQNSFPPMAHSSTRLLNALEEQTSQEETLSTNPFLFETSILPDEESNCPLDLPPLRDWHTFSINGETIDPPSTSENRSLPFLAHSLSSNEVLVNTGNT